MKTLLGLAAIAALGAVASPAPAAAQTYDAPPGSYRSQCTNIRMQGQFLSATCRGGAQSSINVLSCASDIRVDQDGGLVCDGPGVRPGGGSNAAPAYPGQYDQGYGPRAGRNDAYRYDRGGRYGREAATLYSGRNSRGRAVRIEGDTPNLADLGLNDRVRSIQLDRRSGPWQVCTDANYRGRCTTVTSSVADTRRIGMDEGISSLRPIGDAYGRDRRY